MSTPVAAVPCAQTFGVVRTKARRRPGRYDATVGSAAEAPHRLALLAPVLGFVRVAGTRLCITTVV